MDGWMDGLVQRPTAEDVMGCRPVQMGRMYLAESSVKSKQQAFCVFCVLCAFCAFCVLVPHTP